MTTEAASWTRPEDLEPWADNPRDNQEAIAEVAKSIRRFGFGAPIVANSRDKMIIAGHTRLEAAKRLGLDQVPVRWMDLDPVDAKALALADNKVGEFATWDKEGLAAVMADINAIDDSLLANTGFNPQELEELLTSLETFEDVEDPGTGEPPAEPVSQVGEMYELGPHRLICGDSTEKETFDRLLGGELVGGVWTDPPYGVAKVGGNTAFSAESRLDSGCLTVANDNLSGTELTEFLTKSLTNTLDSSKPGAPWYVAAPSRPPMLSFARVLFDMDVWRHSLVWVKNSLVMGQSDYHYKHEVLFYGWTPGGAHPWVGSRAHSSVIEVDKPKRNKEHPTMKPVELIEYCLANHFNGKALIFDPFGGSGSTLIACARLGLQARLIELSPAYCDVIRKRWTKWAVDAGQDPGSGALYDG